MFASRRGGGRGGGRRPPATNIKVPLRGLFADGIWHFYTCQKPRGPSRCDFFLWDDEAKPREESVLLNNSRSEPRATPKTPSKPAQTAQAQEDRSRTPMRNTNAVDRGLNGSKAVVNENREDADEEEPFDWPLTPEETTQLLSSAAERISTTGTPSRRSRPAEDHSSSRSTTLSPSPTHPTLAPHPPDPGTPTRKAPRTDMLTSPGKRRRAVTPPNVTNAGDSWPTPATDSTVQGGNIFTTPKTDSTRRVLFPVSAGPNLKTDRPGPTNEPSLPSPEITPTPYRFKDIPSPITPSTKTSPSPLHQDILTTLHTHNIFLPVPAAEEIKSLCDRHAAKTAGVVRGRDITRAQLVRKESQIVELRQRIMALEAEVETQRALSRGLDRGR
ncbi:MAG: hypothetical protein M1817_000663 [Caeruleum heppii]|nr:MAG: hypothetical protein M1817_000663 [Caeruleum heppii]